MRIEKLNEDFSAKELNILTEAFDDDIMSDASEHNVAAVLEENFENALIRISKGEPPRSTKNILLIGDMGVGKTVGAEDWIKELNSLTPSEYKGIVKWVPMQTAELNNLVGPIVGFGNTDDYSTAELNKEFSKMSAEEKKKAQHELFIGTMPTFEGLEDPEYKYSILFLDEINRGTTFVLSYLVKIINERTISTIGKNGISKTFNQWLFTVAAENPHTIPDPAGKKKGGIELNKEVAELPKALYARFTPVYVYADTKSWCEYALKKYDNISIESVAAAIEKLDLSKVEFNVAKDIPNDAINNIGDLFVKEALRALYEGSDEWEFEDAVKDPTKYSNVEHRISPRTLLEFVLNDASYSVDVAVRKFIGMIYKGQAPGAIDLNAYFLKKFKNNLITEAEGEEREFVTNVLSVIRKYYQPVDIDLLLKDVVKDDDTENTGNTGEVKQKPSNKVIRNATTNFFNQFSGASLNPVQQAKNDVSLRNGGPARPASVDAQTLQGSSALD